MTNAHRDLATPELWTRSLERSRRRRELLPKARREHRSRKHISAALATAVVAGPGAPLAAAQVSGDASAAVAAESPANRAIEIREGGLPLRLGSQGDLVAHVQTKLGVAPDGIFGPQTDAAVRRYQLSAGLDVDGIVGPNTWSSLFGEAGASGAAMGGSNIPPQVKQRVERTLEQAGQELAAQGQAGAGVQPGGQGDAVPPSAGAPTTQGDTTLPTNQGDTTLPTTQAPAGGSCGSTTISTPVHGTVTSNFGPRGGRHHDGVDIAAPSGTPIRAAACGTVSLAGQQSGYGNIVCITHTSQFSTCYAHLSRFGVSNGAHVQQGQVIGYVGCTGNCTGPHLHFETRVNGQAQDPRTYLSGGSIPGRSATVAGASTSGTKTSSTATSQATVTGNGTGSTTATTGATAPASAQPAPAGSEPVASAPAAGVPAASAPASAEPPAAYSAPAESAPEALAVETDTTAAPQAAPEPAAAEPVAPEPVAVDAAAPAKPVSAEPVAAEAAAPTEAVAAEPVAAEAAAPAEPVAAEPVAAEAAAPVEAQVAAPAAPAVDPTAGTGTDTAATTAVDQAQLDVAATAATP
jgi:murein DD-endopeptidase MepM/ murein hydrolase activator NlpD